MPKDLDSAPANQPLNPTQPPIERTDPLTWAQRLKRVVRHSDLRVSGLFADPTTTNAHGLNERMRVQSLYEDHESLDRLTRACAENPWQPFRQ